ncbi:hypothetical protein [Glaciimonas sp. PCH181]|uniref:hypothetical protein n=1 Tax=Glaciimonas sp. PCH181 TaxID=2133943 RepID=UPI000D36DC9B|nr:hypothetical protein [Glaciimonas sp. PCH181]PUA18090.1 hypothetical protein C7W93_19895 [Glaciimonas sp. PCH181]
MFDGFWFGIFGGLFGTAIAQWLSRFKYWVIFLVTALVCTTLLLGLSIYTRGWSGTLRFFFADIHSTLLVIFLPLGLGLSAVFIAVGSLNSRPKASPHANNELKK